ncbi:sterol desaturase family protein [Parafrankia sp. BMG5.11]|uniref:sterol desaturase family protein n=1 Tax=Parafrankia sp. BMG5.11 TaxID=222540 RepID=UPI001404AFCF|nr:sterol desaturase family protein [Parafrankia sp. BMG5.11]
MADYWQVLRQTAVESMAFVIVGPMLLLPFIVAEQLRPVHRRPGWRDYSINILISASTIFLAMPLGVLIGLATERLRHALPWESVGFSYDTIAQVPAIGGMLAVMAMAIVPIVVHDVAFYWAHRIEHRVPFLWEFHKLHHSDELMNCSTWARDHFLQAIWVTVFPALALGLVFDISAFQAGQAALLSGLLLSFLSMFYHSAIRIELPWLDRVVVTPQVYSLHHSCDPQHFNSNFADAFPLLDILFGTYRKPQGGQFPGTGLGDDYPAPRSLWSAQVLPALGGFRALTTYGKAR